MNTNPIYTSFNAGELSELILGRSDLEQYAKGGLEYLNMLVLQYGPFLRRSGSMYVADTKVHATVSRLLEFVFNPTDAFIIEMGVSYFRFYTSDGQVAGPYEVAHTYTASEIDDIHYAQSNDVITLSHHDHKPAKLTRLGAASWTLADYVFKGNPYLDENINAADLMTASVTAKDATGTLTATGGHTPFDTLHTGSFWKMGSPTGSPEIQGYVEITSFVSSTVVNIKVIETLSTAGPTDDWSEAAWSDYKGWPSKVAYHQNALWFANSPAEPNGIWKSKPFIYDNFDIGTGLDDDGIAEKVPDCSEIRWIQGGRTLLVGTDKGEFSGASGDLAALTPNSISFNAQTGWEGEPIQPKVIGNYVYPIQAKGRKLREVFYAFAEDSYKSGDTNSVAEHITLSGIKAVAYQRNPYSILYCVLNNGKMATMTREADQQVLAWTHLETDGFYESVGVIPHPTEPYDMVWAIVRRNINGTDERHVEYFESPIIPDEQDKCWYVDDGLRYNAYPLTDTITLTLSAVTGDGITVTAGAAHFASNDVGQRVRAIDPDTGEILGELDITGYTSTTIVTGNVVKDFSSTSYVGNDWGVSVNTLSGLDHLEAKSVQILVDGGTHANKTVASGAITLDAESDGFVIAVGLGMTSRWRSMPIEAGSGRGTAQGQKKRIYRMDYKFFKSLGMKAGGDVDHLDTIILRDPATLMGQVEPLFTGSYSGAKLDSTWDNEGQIVIEQELPLPLCVLSVIPHVTVNEV